MNNTTIDPLDLISEERVYTKPNNNNNSNTITSEEFLEMSLQEIVDYFNNYKTLKIFMKTLAKIPQKQKIIIFGNDSLLNDDESVISNIKQRYLEYMRLPDSTNSEDESVIETWKNFYSLKCRNLMTSFYILSKRLKQ